ncbi:MAG TPA: UdgX family uracil-DNA binding protein [Vicinamibacteria bacterium]|nr:UdgX family uracil-DNA binding protein [Vicinamibacteria bacterium]
MKPQGAVPCVPATRSLRRLAAAVQDCRGCDLYRGATQAVFGRGPRDAALMLVGEQPGHSEDLEGAPFVGPAGELLDRALERAGIDRGGVYVTNVVKHFKYVREGKRRIHKTPNQGEIEACRPWLFREIELVDPSVLVCLGATASRALLGPAFRLLKERGRFVPSTQGPRTLATIHPSAVLRARDDERARLFELLAGDLAIAQAGLERTRQSGGGSTVK